MATNRAVGWMIRAITTLDDLGRPLWTVLASDGSHHVQTEAATRQEAWRAAGAEVRLLRLDAANRV